MIKHLGILSSFFLCGVAFAHTIEHPTCQLILPTSVEYGDLKEILANKNYELVEMSDLDVVKQPPGTLYAEMNISYELNTHHRPGLDSATSRFEIKRILTNDPFSASILFSATKSHEEFHLYEHKVSFKPSSKAALEAAPNCIKTGQK